ncbi:3,4-dihydroxy-2-butanone-4-phosphate synthase [Pseudomonas panipatensis]|uniref:3,4-dihydroxy-2-butanone 4-phosphate synthase n=1 Tax=Pseudomonas panipatensis TaxID=428992 RepID=A0A1G8ENW0_9PSED|nr:3,4-dihydroxy-2-butanone-4-phosphate synthase [Pseudomonas panipatensis]SDH71552.1 3,4-dihydroxy 2-butanone 4-phosphate synthase / GTP cyclohydrolase II [Pseudomonas panipatensis]SMP68552.1 3,4-dihydroxy 2-butanone 4-phosphate synthase / GTP cyclohydrolase II [Pseudomonas panipatensis]
MPLDSPLQLIEALRRGEPVVLSDGEDDASDGVLLQAAEFADAAAVNFFAREARGLICLALTSERCQALGLEPMVAAPRAGEGPGFTVSIEATSGISTGISAADRARTVQVAVDPASGPADLVSPGHIFPLRALPGGVMSRAGHAEAACDLTRLAGLRPAALLAGILDEDGDNARGETLRAFARRHGLRMGGIAELIHHRILHEGTIARSAEYRLGTRHGEFRVCAYHDAFKDVVHLALVRGEIDSAQPVLVRVQAVETLRDLLAGEPPMGPQQWNLERSLARIAAEGSGVLVLLAQVESAGAILEQLAQGPRLRPPQFPQRTLGVGAQILRDLGVRKMRLMSFPVTYKAVSGFELEVVEFVPFSVGQEE